LVQAGTEPGLPQRRTKSGRHDSGSSAPSSRLGSSSTGAAEPSHITTIV